MSKGKCTEVGGRRKDRGDTYFMVDRLNKVDANKSGYMWPRGRGVIR